jgi:acyl-CoA reductase-like NAD-dependent aldehyde dehydrogenase
MERAAAIPSAPPASGNGASAESEAIEVHRPADGSVIRQVPIDPPERVAEVVSRVRAAQPEWEAIGFAGRRRWLERLRDWLIANETRVADIMQEETGRFAPRPSRRRRSSAARSTTTASTAPSFSPRSPPLRTSCRSG